MSAAPRALVLMLAALMGAVSLAPPFDAGPLPPTALYQRTLSGVAWVYTSDNAKGTGWLVDRERRLLVTAAHVIGESATADVIYPVRRDGRVIAERAWYLEHLPELRAQGQAVRGRVLARDPTCDLALLQLERVPTEARALPLARSAYPGQWVQSVGCRYDSEILWGHTAGVVRQVQTLRDGYFSGGRQLAKGARVILAQAPINEGDSGAPLVNDRGEVVGVAAAVAWEAQGSGLFIEVGQVRALLGQACHEPPAAIATPSSAALLYHRAVPSVAFVQGTPTDRRATAFVLDAPRRLLLTTADAVGARRSIVVTFPVVAKGSIIAEPAFYRENVDLLKQQSRRGVGVVLATDPRRNLALLEVPSLPTATAAIELAADPPLPGETLHVISNPARLDVLWVYTAAHARQLGRTVLDATHDGPAPAVVLLQAPLPEGEGGGPALDALGRAVAVVSGKSSPQQQICHALQAAEIRAFLDERRSQWSPRTAAEHAARGERLVEARQYARAVDAFSTALTIDPKHAAALAGRGTARLLQGDAMRALADCEAALSHDPKCIAAWTTRAAIHCARGKPAMALADCDHALAIDPRSAPALTQRGRARGLLGELEAGIADCDEAIWLERRSAQAHLYRGELHERKGNLEAAIADFTRAAQLDDQRAEPLRRRGDVHWRKDDVSAAQADYAAALAIDPADASAHRGRANTLAARGEAVQAAEAFGEALRASPVDGDATLAALQRCIERLARHDSASAALLAEKSLAAISVWIASATVRQQLQRAVELARNEADASLRARQLLEAIRRARSELTSDPGR